MAHSTTSGGFNPSSSKLLIEVSAVLAVVVVVGAAVIFAGGRLASWATPLVPMSFDRKIGELSQQQFSMTQSDCDNPEVLAYVEQLAAPLLEQAEPLPFEFQFRVADTEVVNAFALPGGFVTVNYGLLKEAKTGEEVAGVIGHEIQHALLRHGTKRILRQMGSSALMMLIFGASDLHSLGQAAGQLVSLSYDRGQESEADVRGVELMVQAGMDPRGLSSFFERLAEGSLRPPEILSTHPDPGDRAALVTEAARGAHFGSLPSPQGLSCHR